MSALKDKGLSEDKIVEYQAAFQLFDGGGRGVIDVSTLGGLLNGTFGTLCLPLTSNPDSLGSSIGRDALLAGRLCRSKLQ